MIHKSNANVAPFIPDKVPRQSEYKMKFKSWSPGKQPVSTHQQQLMDNAEREIKAKYRLKTKVRSARQFFKEICYLLYDTNIHRFTLNTEDNDGGKLPLKYYLLRYCSEKQVKQCRENNFRLGDTTSFHTFKTLLKAHLFQEAYHQ